MSHLRVLRQSHILLSCAAPASTTPRMLWTSLLVFAATSAVTALPSSTHSLSLARLPVTRVSLHVPSSLRLSEGPNDERPEQPPRSKKSVLETLANDERFSKLLSVVSEAGGSFEGDFDKKRVTVFAPTNDAFKAFGGKIPDEEAVQSLLRYHVISNYAIHEDSLFDGALLHTDLHLPGLNNKSQVLHVSKREGNFVLNMHATIQQVGIEAENGVIHVIDTLLIPPPNAYEMLSMLPVEFSTTALALELTKLNEPLSHAPSLTLFIPSNTAWQSLGHKRLVQLFSPENRQKLRSLLLYHASPKLYYSPDLHPQSCCGTTDDDDDKHDDDGDQPVPGPGHGDIQLPTFLGTASLTVEAHFGGDDRRRVMVKVNGQQVQVQDIPASNGVINVVEQVLCPPSEDGDSIIEC